MHNVWLPTSIAGNSRLIASMLLTIWTAAIMIILSRLLVLILEVVIFLLVTLSLIPLLLIAELISFLHRPFHIDSYVIHILIEGILMH